MVIKDAKKYSSEGTTQKKNKTKKASRNPFVIIDGDDDDAQFGLLTKARRGEKKHLVVGNGSNVKKKKKKKKKKKLDSKLLKNAAFADLPITAQSSSDLESIKEAENPPKALKKKRKRGLSCKQESDPEIPSQGQTTECLEANFLVGKRRKRSVPETRGGNNGCSPKRKKKKHKLACSLIPSHAEDDYSKKDLPPTMKMISHEMTPSGRKPTLIQAAVSTGESKCVCCFTSMDSQETRNGGLEKGTADPIDELQEENNCKQDHKEITASKIHISKKRRQVTEQEVHKKRKKKKKLKEETDFHLTSAGSQENHPAVSTETLWKTKAEEKMRKIDLIQNSKGDSKGHKIYTKVANNYPALLEDNTDAFDWEEKAVAIKRNKKKAKKPKKRLDPAAGLKSKQCAATERKAKKREGPERAEEPSSKQAKLKEEAEEGEDEIQVITIKKGNCDEAKIDKSRRQALQEEIDRESGKTKAIKEDNKSDHHFGQWSTAAFDNAERKTKFLRLLGGFKKGPALTEESPTRVTKHNMALARHSEEKLQQRLQAEFEKAVGWKQRPGAGLGFQLASRKQVHRDKYASKSVKFVD
ncbi:lysine-rich nucleolar protein 1 [Heteronotia binoei]|uniref:lysine-rich nucleolar protein 1 n=1 Tax=Heteronotia binoei TaxID=13085 RepID=UPI00292CCAD8|nr:lysine-rich nucleolar protein 1 [Heteronotia binoei]XP_060116482.1 lysine-rich nucleolar protein 1 [Heteronotia binoei]